MMLLDSGMEVIMNDELANLDADLKELFVEDKIDDMIDLLQKNDTNTVKELAEYNWSIIKKYYEMENFELLFAHFRFVAYTCFLVEYGHQAGIISEEAFTIMMQVYNDIYEIKRNRA
jgi:hypothetical protein